jgi:hypothetical protein
VNGNPAGSCGLSARGDRTVLIDGYVDPADAAMHSLI